MTMLARPFQREDLGRSREGSLVPTSMNRPHGSVASSQGQSRNPQATPLSQSSNSRSAVSNMAKFPSKENDTPNVYAASPSFSAISKSSRPPQMARNLGLPRGRLTAPSPSVASIRTAGRGMPGQSPFARSVTSKVAPSPSVLSMGKFAPSPSVGSTLGRSLPSSTPRLLSSTARKPFTSFSSGVLARNSRNMGRTGPGPRAMHSNTSSFPQKDKMGGPVRPADSQVRGSFRGGQFGMNRKPEFNRPAYNQNGMRSGNNFAPRGRFTGGFRAGAPRPYDPLMAIERYKQSGGLFIPFARLKRPVTLLDVESEILNQSNVSIQLVPVVQKRTDSIIYRVNINNPEASSVKVQSTKSRGLEDDLEALFQTRSRDIETSLTNFHRGMCFRYTLNQFFIFANGIVKHIKTPIHCHFRFGYLSTTGHALEDTGPMKHSVRNLTPLEWVDYDNNAHGTMSFLNGVSYTSIVTLLKHFKKDEKLFWDLMENDEFNNCYMLYQTEDKKRRLSVDLEADEDKWRIRHVRNAENYASIRMTLCQGNIDIPDARFYVHTRGEEVIYDPNNPLHEYVQFHLESNNLVMMTNTSDLPDECFYIRYRKKFKFHYNDFKITIDRQRSLFCNKPEPDEKFDVKVVYLPWKRQLKENPSENWYRVVTGATFKEQAKLVTDFVRQMAGILRDNSIFEKQIYQ